MTRVGVEAGAATPPPDARPPHPGGASREATGRGRRRHATTTRKPTRIVSKGDYSGRCTRGVSDGMDRRSHVFIYAVHSVESLTVEVTRD